MDKKKIVLTANTDWYIYNFRKELIVSLLENNWEVVIISPYGEYVDKLINLGCSHIPWEVGRQSINPFIEWRSIRKLKEIFLGMEPTLIHQHTLKAVLYGNFAARKSRIPIVNSIAGRGYVYSSDEFRAKLIKPVLDLLFRWSMNYPNQEVIFENKIDLQYFVDKGFITHDICNLIQSVGVDVELYKPSPVPGFDKFAVGYVGRMLWNKGVGVFVEAARLLKRDKPNFRMVLVGTPDPGNPENIPAEQLREWEKEGIIEWWGWQANMAKVYKKLHALAFPTNYGEGVPTVLLEAGASQRALIASDTPGCREVIEDGEQGFLIPANDAAALAKRIAFFRENESEYHRMRESVYMKILDSFSTDVVFEKTFKVYHKLQIKSEPPE